MREWDKERQVWPAWACVGFEIMRDAEQLVREGGPTLDLSPIKGTLDALREQDRQYAQDFCDALAASPYLVRSMFRDYQHPAVPLRKTDDNPHILEVQLYAQGAAVVLVYEFNNPTRPPGWYTENGMCLVYKDRLTETGEHVRVPPDEEF